jgi:hypothetical protein
MNATMAQGEDSRKPICRALSKNIRTFKPNTAAELFDIYRESDI